MQELIEHRDGINRQLARYGVKFGIYKNGNFQERLFPFDPLPRIITAQEFATLDKGLVQRVTALNLFLRDLYGDKKIIREGIVPEDFAFAGSGYLPACDGFTPPKGIYYFVPKMIRYYLGEEPILQNAPTYLPFYEQDRSYVLANLEKLVVKDVAEAGGYGVVFGRDLTQEKRADLADLIKREPRRFIAQEVIDFKDLPIMENGREVPRKGKASVCG